MATSWMMRRFSLSGSFIMLGLILLLGASPVAQASTGLEFTCRAQAFNLNGQSLGTTFAPPTFTCATNTATQKNLNITTGGYTITATDLQASTSLGSSSVRADASMKHLKITFVDNGQTNIITADAATSESTGVCTNGSATGTNTATFPNLKVNGQSPTTSPFPLPGGGTLFINSKSTLTHPGITQNEAAAFQILPATSTQALTVASTQTTAQCIPGVPPTGGGPIASLTAGPPWLLWGGLLTTLGLAGLGATLVARKRRLA
jgi:hypothetical protein